MFNVKESTRVSLITADLIPACAIRIIIADCSVHERESGSCLVINEKYKLHIVENFPLLNSFKLWNYLNKTMKFIFYFFFRSTHR